MGLACGIRFAEEGASIVIGDILDDAGLAAVLAVEEVGGKAMFVHYDATSARDANTLMGEAVDSFGSLDVLVAAAGVTHAGYRSGDLESERRLRVERGAAAFDPAGQVIDFPLDEWDKVLAVNLTGMLFAIQAAARRMRDHGRGGSIVTFSSIAAKAAQIAPVSYAVSKAGVWALTKNAAAALASVGIRVNAIGPGMIDTNMSAMLKEDPKAMKALMMHVPMGRLGTAREVASAALFLACDESSYFTGEMFHPDGGYYTD
jgi:3-oxoacyl-[acyl-carrier protein] reductase